MSTRNVARSMTFKLGFGMLDHAELFTRSLKYPASFLAVEVCP